MPSRSHLRRTFAILTLCTIGVLGALLFGLAANQRGRLRESIQRREAEAIYAAARLEINAAEGRNAKLGAPFSDEDLFAAVLESSRLSGVLAVQRFDPQGVLREALPSVASEAIGDTTWWPRPLTAPTARFHPAATLETFGLGRPNPGSDPRVPLLEVVVPLGHRRGEDQLGVARYWIDGSALQAEFRRLDLSLLAQTVVALAGGALLMLALATWAHRRLEEAERQLLERTTDLARANEELNFAAKTGALGAISAHLIHGLKNPLAGLEGFVSADASPAATSEAGDARRTAVDTARRLRGMVNDVVAVLRDEANGDADYVVPVAEMLSAAEARAAAVASEAGVKLSVQSSPSIALKARNANLAGLVLANLITNAIEASPRGSKVEVAARADDGQIAFLVRDGGPGLPETVRAHLFRPVKSTKPTGGGMGLAISHRLARHAGGDLSIVRTDSTGTEFKLTVPAA